MAVDAEDAPENASALFELGPVFRRQDGGRHLARAIDIIIVEPVQGEGGIYPAEESWLRALRKRCDETGAVLIFDEIQVSLFALRHVTVVVPALRVTWDANVRSCLAADSVGYTGPGRCGHILPYRPTVIPIL